MKNGVHKKKVAFILPSLGAGGSERVILNVLKYWDRESSTPVLIVLDKRGKLADQVPDDIEVIDLGCKKVRHSLWKLVYVLRRIKPDSVLVTLNHLIAVFPIIRYFIPRSIRIYARMSIVPEHVKNIENHYSKISLLLKLFLSAYDGVVCQSYFMKNALISQFNIDPKKVYVIYNPIDSSKILPYLHPACSTNYKKSSSFDILAIGRLSSQKRFDRLIEAMRMLADLPVRLFICGEGPLEEWLKEYASQLGVDHIVHFLGHQSNVYELMIRSDILVMTSEFEGIPNVALEANACGLPVISFLFPGGIDEIIKDGLNGYLIRDCQVETLAEVIRKIVHDYPFERKKISDITLQQYGAAHIVPKFQHLLLSNSPN